MERQVQEPFHWDFCPRAAYFLGRTPRIARCSRVSRSTSADHIQYPTGLSWSKPQPAYRNTSSPSQARLAKLLPAERLAEELRFEFPISQMDFSRNPLSNDRWWRSRP